MLAKQATVSLALLFLTLTLTQSSALADCNGFSSFVDVMTYYNIPIGLFPNDVQHLSCKPEEGGSIRLAIHLNEECIVTKQVFKPGMIAKFEQVMTATMSDKKVTDIKGVTLEHPKGKSQDLTGITIFDLYGQLDRFAQLQSGTSSSPLLHVSSVFDKPPTCDKETYKTPISAYRYGRIILPPLVVA